MTRYQVILSICAILATFLIPWKLVAQTPTAEVASTNAALVATVKGLFKDLKTETLPNGLKVYMLPVPGHPTVTTMVAYKVGACDEDKDQTGLSHYLEHLLFKGTDKYFPGDIDRATQRNGGRNNAYTSEDMTVYHFDFAADRFGIALEIEADRMRNVRIDAKHEFEQEKGAVIAELKGGEDRPFELEYKAILPLLFAPKAPYAHPVIGEEEHVRGATAEIITRYYDKWYHPNNAALVIVGGFDPESTMATVRKLFGPILKAELPERKPDLPARIATQQVRKEIVSKFEVPRVLIGFNAMKAGDADEPAMILLDSILTSGRTSRLFKKLVEEERLVNYVGAYLSAGRYPGWYGLQIEMLPGKDRQTMEQVLFAEFERLTTELVNESELNRAKRSLLAAEIFAKEDVHALCDFIAQKVTLDQADDLQKYLDQLCAVTPEQIRAVAKKYLRKEAAVVVWSLPSQAPAKDGENSARASGNRKGNEPRFGRAYRSNPTPRNAADGGGPEHAPVSLNQAKRTVLKNGLTLITLENRRLPIVSGSVFVNGVRLAEPASQSGIASFVGSMLEEGTARLSGAEIAAAIEDVGGSLSFTSNGGSVSVLTPDTQLGFTLLFESLIQPSFPADALERVREQLLSAIEETETQPRNRAAANFNKLVYGEHPFGRSVFGERAIVEALKAEDLQAFHKNHFVPNRTIVVVVGDINTAEVTRTVERLCVNWKPNWQAVPSPAAPPAYEQQTAKIIPDASAAQTHIFIGHLGIRRDDPDYHALQVMDNVLGTGPGFTDRLSANLRDRQGLAYTVTAQIAASASEQPGAFTGYIGTFPDKFLWVREGFLKEVNRMRDEPATEQEVEDAKRYLLGSLPFRISTNQAIAGQLLTAERYKLGFDYLEQYARAIQAVTVADVQRVARKHLKPDQIIISVVGPIDEQGKPVATPKNQTK